MRSPAALLPSYQRLTPMWDGVNRLCAPILTLFRT
jgi:hypothetical protein